MIDVITGKKIFWSITNKRVKKFIQSYGFIEPIFDKYHNAQLIRINDEMTKFNDFIYDTSKIFIPQNVNIYNDLKQHISDYNYILKCIDNEINVHKARYELSQFFIIKRTIVILKIYIQMILLHIYLYVHLYLYYT